MAIKTLTGSMPLASNPSAPTMPPSASEKAASDGKENKEGAITDAAWR